jgi:branched-subunit amino acid transport protein
MSETAIWVVILSIGVLGLAMRGAVLLLPIRSEAMPRWAQDLLSLVPAAVFGALVAPLLVLDDGHLRLWAPGTLAGCLALVVGIGTRNLVTTMAAGLVAYAALDALLF